MTDWCKGFCRTCGTGCAEYCEEIKNLRSQLNTPDDGSLMMIQHMRQQVAEKDAEITRLHEKYDLQRLVKRDEKLEAVANAARIIRHGRLAGWNSLAKALAALDSAGGGK